MNNNNNLEHIRHKPDSRQEIIDAAATCFMRRGLEKATIDDIADELGATKGRVYHHFRSKNAIYFAVHRQAMQFCFDAVDPILDLRINAHDKLMRMAVAHAHVMMDTLPYQRSVSLGVEIYLRGSTTEAERAVLVELIALRKGYEELYRQVLKEGIVDGSLNVPDVALAGRAIIGALNGLVNWYPVRLDESRTDRNRLATLLAATVINGVRR